MALETWEDTILNSKFLMAYKEQLVKTNKQKKIHECVHVNKRQLKSHGANASDIISAFPKMLLLHLFQ